MGVCIWACVYGLRIYIYSIHTTRNSLPFMHEHAHVLAYSVNVNLDWTLASRVQREVEPVIQLLLSLPQKYQMQNT